MTGIDLEIKVDGQELIPKVGGGGAEMLPGDSNKEGRDFQVW